jgi:hypothetical protein
MLADRQPGRPRSGRCRGALGCSVAGHGQQNGLSDPSLHYFLLCRSANEVPDGRCALAGCRLYVHHLARSTCLGHAQRGACLNLEPCHGPWPLLLDSRDLHGICQNDATHGPWSGAGQLPHCTLRPHPCLSSTLSSLRSAGSRMRARRPAGIIYKTATSPAHPSASLALHSSQLTHLSSNLES